MKEFYSFRLDTVNECLWRRQDNGDDERIRLAPKTFVVLCYLVDHPGRLITHDELLNTLWPDTFVQREVLKGHILSIRTALGDSAKNPRFIETLPKRGYQFIAPVRSTALIRHPAVTEVSRKIVGRNEQLLALLKLLQRTLANQHETVFITGEPGIGKTALVDEFLRLTGADCPGLRVARGQCVEGYGGKEPYYPVLEALGQLCASAGNAVIETLSTHAPTWLVQFPALVTSEKREMLQREIVGATRERMLREIGQALETIASEDPLLLVLEDLHWADSSTVDLISALARRRTVGKLMVIGTYRPVDLTLAQHPLRAVKQDLLVHRLCHEIVLEPLREAEVADYLAIEAAGLPAPEGLAGLIYRHTEGNPLFMVTAVAHMCDRGLIALEDGRWQIKVPLEKIDLEAPETLRQMIEVQIERLSEEEQRILEVASVLRKFSLAVTMGAAVANRNPDTVEELLEGLARRHQVIRPAGSREYRNGLSACYEFVHVLYRQVLYDRIAPDRRRKLHRSMAENGEALRILRGVTMDTELAYQFEEGGDWLRAVKYLLSAADMAGRRFEPQRAAEILEHALELVNKIPEAERAQSEIAVLQKLCTIYSTSFDQRALTTYEALAARAAYYGLPEVEVHALLEMAFPLALVRADDYMRALARTFEAQLRFGEGDALQRVAMRALYICRRTGAGKWEQGNTEECRSLIAKLRETDDRRYLGEVQLGFGFSLLHFSKYREAQRNAEEGYAIFLKGYEENPYLTWHFQLHQDIVCSSLLFLGEWGEALRTINRWIEMGDKNRDRHSAMIARLGRIELQIQTMDFNGAKQILESALPVVAPMLRIRRYWLIWAGSAEAGLGNRDRALEHFLKCREDMDHQPMTADWYYRMPLQLALTELWLGTAELGKARTEADLLLKVTLPTEERTFRALAWEVNARVAMGEQDLDKALDCLAKGLQSINDYEVPLAEWRVHATASELHRRLGNEALAENHRQFSLATIMKLADSLSAEEPLQKTFLSAPLVRSVLDGVQVETTNAGRQRPDRVV